jgi:hypothetical protein
MVGISRLYAKIPYEKKSKLSLQIQRKKSSKPLKSPVDRILFLQRTIGNQAVQRLIKSGTLQAKLRICQPDDIYEQEADRMGDAVMRMSEPTVTSSDVPYIQRACPTCEEDELRQQPIEEEEEEELQAKVISGNISKANPNLESQIQSFKGGGQTLSGKDRAFFEPRFGHDFSQVRVHTGAKAAESARAVNARAFTVGGDVVFGTGKYAPGTSEGKRLLAHELTHVVQQQGTIGSCCQPLLINVISIQPTMIQRDINYDLFLRGENYWFPNQGQARIAALARATQLGPGHTITHHPSPAVGQSHYHIVNPLRRQVAGHFFYGRRPPRKHRRWRREGERVRSRREAERRMRESLPAWLLAILSAAAIAAIIACFASGVCEAGIIIAAAGAAAAAVIIGILIASGVEVEGREEGPPIA